MEKYNVSIKYKSQPEWLATMSEHMNLKHMLSKLRTS